MAGLPRLLRSTTHCSRRPPALPFRWAASRRCIRGSPCQGQGESPRMIGHGVLRVPLRVFSNSCQDLAFGLGYQKIKNEIWESLVSTSSDPVTRQGWQARPDFGGLLAARRLETSGKRSAGLETWRMLIFRCQCDTEMGPLGLALQHMKADIHRVTLRD